MFLNFTVRKQKTAFKQMTVCKQKTVYLCWTELFEIEQFLNLTVYSYRIQVNPFNYVK